MRIFSTSFLILGSLSAAVSVRADGLLVSFYNTSTVGLYNAQTGALLNSTFATVQDALGLALGPGNTVFVGSDGLDGPSGAGIVRFGINGTTGTPLGTFVDHVGDNALNNPQGLAFHSGNLYASDITAGNVFVYNSSGAHINTLTPPVNLSFGNPAGLAFDQAGTLYIADIGLGNVLSYGSGNFAQVNSSSGIFQDAHSVVVGGDGNLYVLNTSSASGGIYSLSLSDGSSTKIVDYSTVNFQPSDMVLGPDGKLYVSGQDTFSAEGEILQYNRDGSGGAQFADTGFGTSPGYITFIPEPSTLSIMGAALVVGGIFLRKKYSKY